MEGSALVASGHLTMPLSSGSEDPTLPRDGTDSPWPLRHVLCQETDATARRLLMTH